MKLRILRFLTPFVLGLGSAPAFSEALPATTGEPVLTVSGEIGVSNIGDTAVFDIDMLRALPSYSYTTSTIWTDGVSTFSGVPLWEVLEIVNAGGSQIYASAINDYSVTIPVDSVTEQVPLIAYELDGEAMPRRQKGPLWIVYPYDHSAEYQSEQVYSRSIWQLDRIEVLP